MAEIDSPITPGKNDPKPAGKNEDRLKALLHLLPIGISILNHERKPIYTNPALEAILGLTGGELRGGKYSQRKYLKADGQEMPIEEFPSARAFDTGKAIQNVEVGIVKEDDSIIWTMVSAVPLSRADWRVVLTVIDITERKQARSTLQLQATELLARVNALNFFYSMSDLVERPGITLNEIIQGTTDLIPAAFSHSQYTWARIEFNRQQFTTAGFRRSSRLQSQPLIVRGQPIGVVEVHFGARSENDLFTDPNLLKAIAERLGRIIERFQAEEKLLVLATTDPLTELYNRRHFFELAIIEIERAQRYHRPLSCMMFDVDYFKNINDTQGHRYGDMVLQEMVKRCRDNIRRVDIFARYGGDEFVILLPETGIQRAVRLANRLRDGFQKQDLQIQGRITPITLSVGVASMNGNSDLNLDTLLVRADQALYKAKEKGRNQVSFWPANEPNPL